ncbi:MAG: Hsp20/alpha crystallin family protein [Pseudomonadota bacterium]
MNIVRRNAPSRGLGLRAMPIDDQLGRVVENMMQDFLAPFMPYSGLAAGGQAQDMAIAPPINVVETNNAFEVEVEVPGVRKEDVKVSIDGQRVSIEAEAKRESAQKEGENMVYAERTIKKFSRTFILPVEVNEDGAQARLEDGILKLSLPKKESGQAKQLTVQ